MSYNYFLKVVEFEKWANQRVVVYLDKNANDHRSLSIFNHLLADIEPWLSVIEQLKRSLVHVGYPDWHLEECKEKLAETMGRLTNILFMLKTRNMNETIVSCGGEKNTIEEILGHIFSHSQHHRGQLELLMHEHTNEYTNLGYMYYLRTERKGT